MTETLIRGPVWPASDGTFHRTAKARDAHEAREDLAAPFERWINEVLAAADAKDAELARDSGVYIAEQIVADPRPILAAMRKAGIKLVQRQPETKPRKRRDKAASTEAQAAE